MKWSCHVGRQFGRLTKLNIFLPYDPVIMLLGYLPKRWKSYIHTKTCAWMFIAALFILAETRERPRCPSAGEQKKRRENGGTSKQMEYYSALKRNKLPSHRTAWKHLMCMLPKKKSRSDKNTYCTTSILYSSGKGKFLGSLGQSCVFTGVSRERR